MRRLLPIMERPRTRADCEQGPRPCPWVGCRHHLYLEADAGRVRLNYAAHVEAGELEPSCSLDVAADGPHRLDDLAEVLCVSRERVRQIEQAALAKVRAALVGVFVGDDEVVATLERMLAQSSKLDETK